MRDERGSSSPWESDGDPWAAGESGSVDNWWAEYADVPTGVRRERKGPEQSATDEKFQAVLDNNDQEQAHGLRKNFFWVITALLITTVAGSFLAMAAYMFASWHDIRSEVMVSWFAAVVANTIGLALVIANYLFPSNRRRKKRRRKKRRH